MSSMAFREQELRILKNIITNKNVGLEFANNYDAALFSSELWSVANLVINYIKAYKNVPTLRILKEKITNETLKNKIIAIWEAFDKIVIDEKEFQYDVGQLKQQFAEKQIIEAKTQLSKLETGNIDVSKTLADLQKTIQNISKVNEQQLYQSKDIKDFLPEFVENFNAKMNNPKIEKGLMTKYSFIDYATNGLKSADYVLICGESGFGKSLVLQNMAIQIWLQDNSIGTENFSEGKDIIYFSLEMPYSDLFHRLLSRLSGVPSRNIENAKMSREEMQRVKSCLDFIKNYPYEFRIVDIQDARANDLEEILRNSGKKYSSVFIDYLGIMEPNEKQENQDWLKQSVISQEIRGIARKYNIPIFSAAQLNRKNNKEGSDQIGLNRLARSNGIATHSTLVLQIESRINEDKFPDMQIHVIKNRKGPKGKFNLIKDLSRATLLDNTNGVPDEIYDDFFPDQDDISKAMEKLTL